MVIKDIRIAWLLIVLFFSFNCKSGQEPNARPQIICTTGMIADAVQNICGNWADVNALMGAGVDPHLYKASQGDTEKLSNADLLVYNGLHLEGKMEAVLKKLAARKKVIPLGEYLSRCTFANRRCCAIVRTGRLYRSAHLDGPPALEIGTREITVRFNAPISRT